MANSRQPATRQYVDQGHEAANRYAESLFGRAVTRLNERIAEERTDAAVRLEARLQEALGTIRPAPTVYPPVKANGWTRLTIIRQDGRLRLSLR